MKIKDRYAPSPTGLQHIGGVRTALFNYLFAKSLGGTFVLRLEDTDRARFDTKFVQNLYDTFRWLGLQWDEGPDNGGPAAPYIQSERLGLYRRHAQELAGAGNAYYCFCSPQRLAALREAQGAEAGYDRRCRNMGRGEQEALEARGEVPVLRLKIPLEEGAATVFRDRLLGTVTWKNADINSDPVLLKSDGFPTYHLANVVDDHLMGITHVLRAQEWLPSTPVHVIMYRAFGWEPPEFCHLPMVMGPDGKKLSKRHGATSIDEFRRQGYLPEALINYVALLGASYEEGKDMYTLAELAARFSIDKLNKAPAVFDYKKLEWYNSRYIRGKTDGELARLALPWAREAGLFGAQGAEPAEAQYAAFSSAMPLIRERVSSLREIPGKIRYLFAEPDLPPAADFIPKKKDLAETVRLLSIGRGFIAAIGPASDREAEDLAKEQAGKAGVALGDLMTPLRAALTGSKVSPPLFGSIRILGRERSLARVDRALRFLNG
ncbi:MAG: glutamate--tRNA ligase [Spirochaetaceae bacterium]|jgi:glutamyl-tRNA synthetase|nr:glutamate--tRNA ligase [Spirochaetaceae bacterium]